MRDAKVTLMAVAGDQFSSRLIEWRSIGWAHFASILPDGSVLDSRADIVKVKGACYPEGVQLRPKGYLDTEPRWLKVEIPCTHAQANAWETALRSQLNKPYDFPGIWSFVTEGKDRNWREQSAWFCSELGLWALERAGICHQLDMPAFRFTPGDAIAICAALGHVVASKGIGKKLAA